MVGRRDASGEHDVVIDDDRGGRHDSPRHDLAGVGDLVDLDVEAKSVEAARVSVSKVLAVDTSGAKDLDVHGGAPCGFESDENEVEQVSDGEDAGGDHGDIGGDQLGHQHPAQQDHLGQRQCDDAHHEREHGAHRQALVVQDLDERQDPGGVGIQRHPDQHGDWHAEHAGGVLGEPVLRRPPVDQGTDTDADEQVGPHLAQNRADFHATHLDAVVP